jgi:ATP/maltotriose-dependent transcriptional regulator MalT
MTALPFPYITTKLHIPETRVERMPRPALMRRLGCYARTKMLLVSAPAGFGKTTLLGEWSHKSRWPVVWVSLDTTDNDPIHFWSYVVAALEKIEPRVGQNVLPLLHAPRPSPVEYLIPALINTVAALPDRLALVLDDYHCIESGTIHDALAYLIDYMPPNMHLIIASRTAPPLPLARWRARGQLGELGVADLRFSPEETEHLLNKVMALDLPAEAVAALQARTEGWIAGLHLATLARQEERLGTRGIEGSHRYVADYMASEVLDQQPPEIRAFLLRTANLEVLNGPLCDAVTGRTDSLTLLDELRRRNLFVVALDHKGHYRYHRLFADAIRGEATRDPALDLPNLHRRAASWYEANGDTSRSMAHLLSGGWVDEAVALVERTARDHLMRGELETLRSWFSSLPEDEIRSRPELCLVYAWALTHAGQLDAAEQYLDCLASGPIGGSQAGRLLGESASVHARIAVVRGDNEGMIHFSKKALSLLPVEATALRGDALLDLAFAYGAHDEFGVAQQAFDRAIEQSRASGNLRVAMMALYYLGDLYSAQGHLHRAVQLYRQGLAWCQRIAPSSGQACWAHAGLGTLLYEWNDVDAALDHLGHAVRLGQQCGEVKVLMYPRIPLSHALQAVGRTEEALAALDAAAEVARQTNILEIAHQIDLARIQTWLRAGRIDLATAWIRQQGLGVQDSALEPVEVELLAWIELAAHGAERTADPRGLARIVDLLDPGQGVTAPKRTYPWVGRLAILSLVQQALGHPDRAAEALARALQLAEPMGLIRTFVDLGPAMAALLSKRDALRRTARRQRTTVGEAYLEALLDAFEGASTPISVSAPTQPEGTIEPLRPREIEVLHHIAQGRSNREIAEEMVMAVSTVKWYLRGIYGKFQVHRRTQALARARELDLI